MIYKFAHWLRDHADWLWNLAEKINSWAFSIRFRSGLGRVNDTLQRESDAMILLKQATLEDVPKLVRFFTDQPETAFEFFRPHAFDEKTMKSLVQRKSFIIILAFQGETLVGYGFLRSFVHGVSYMGKMVGHNVQGQGIGKRLCLATMHVAQTVGIRMFESISRRNIASMRSSAAVLRQVIVKELDDDDLLIEDFPIE